LPCYCASSGFCSSLFEKHPVFAGPYLQRKEKTMNSYLVKLVYQIVCGDGQHMPQFDEQLRFLAAQDEKEALHKGRYIGVQEEEIFYNNRQQMVQWKFINVSEIYSLDELSDGAEVFSQIREIDDPHSYCSFVHHKAAQLLRQPASFTIQTA